MNSNILTSAVNSVNASPIVTPISSIISNAAPKTSMVQASTVSDTAEAVAESVAASATEQVSSKMSEKVILGMSQKSLIIGGAVAGTILVAGGGFYMWNRHMRTPKAGVDMVLSAGSNAKGDIIVTLPCGSKITKAEKKSAKEITRGMKGLDADKIFSSIRQVAESDNPSFFGVDLRKFPGTNVVFESIDDRCAFGAALVHQAAFRSGGFPAALEYSRGKNDGDRAHIKVIPYVNGKPVNMMEIVDLDAPMDEGESK